MLCICTTCIAVRCICISCICMLCILTRCTWWTCTWRGSIRTPPCARVCYYRNCNLQSYFRKIFQIKLQNLPNQVILYCNSTLMKKLFWKISSSFPAIFILFFISSCHKYPDGPEISVHTKTHRLANSWIFRQVLETDASGNTTDKTTDYESMYYMFNLIFSKGNVYSLNYALNNITAYDETGTWVYNDDKTHIILSKTSSGSGSGFDGDWELLKLKEKELWMKTAQSNGTVLEIHFVPRFR